MAKQTAGDKTVADESGSEVGVDWIDKVAFIAMVHGIPFHGCKVTKTKRGMRATFFFRNTPELQAAIEDFEARQREAPMEMTNKVDPDTAMAIFTYQQRVRAMKSNIERAG